MFRVPDTVRQSMMQNDQPEKLQRQMSRGDNFLDCVAQSFYFLGFNETWTRELRNNVALTGTSDHILRSSTDHYGRRVGLYHDGLARSTADGNRFENISFNIVRSGNLFGQDIDIVRAVLQNIWANIAPGYGVMGLIRFQNSNMGHAIVFGVWSDGTPYVYDQQRGYFGTETAGGEAYARQMLESRINDVGIVDAITNTGDKANFERVPYGTGHILQLNTAPQNWHETPESKAALAEALAASAKLAETPSAAAQESDLPPLKPDLQRMVDDGSISSEQAYSMMYSDGVQPSRDGESKKDSAPAAPAAPVAAAPAAAADPLSSDLRQLVDAGELGYEDAMNMMVGGKRKKKRKSRKKKRKSRKKKRKSRKKKRKSRKKKRKSRKKKRKTKKSRKR